MSARSLPALRASLLIVLAGCGGGVTSLPSAQNPRTGDAASVHIGAREIGLGTHDDALSPGDPQQESGRHERAYQIALDPSQRVRFRVAAGELDPMLRIEGSGDFRLENDDVSPHSPPQTSLPFAG